MTGPSRRPPSAPIAGLVFWGVALITAGVVALASAPLRIGGEPDRHGVLAHRFVGGHRYLGLADARQEWDVELPADVCLDLEIDANAVESDLELDGAELTSLAVDANAGGVGIGLVLIGLWFLLREYVPQIDWGFVWPLVVVGIGALIVLNSLRRG